MLGVGAKFPFKVMQIVRCTSGSTIHHIVSYIVTMTVLLQMPVRCLEERVLLSNVHKVAVIASHGAE